MIVYKCDCPRRDCLRFLWVTVGAGDVVLTMHQTYQYSSATEVLRFELETAERLACDLAVAIDEVRRQLTEDEASLDSAEEDSVDAESAATAPPNPGEEV